MNIDIPFDQPLLMLAAIATAVLCVGRLSRIVVHDDFPPAAWVRSKWSAFTKYGTWSKLLTCFWCFTPWLMLFCLTWGILSSLHWSWFAFWGWLGLSYLSSMVIARDEPQE